MTIFEILKTIFCCGSSTVPPEEEPILSATDSVNGTASPDAYINIGGMLGSNGNAFVTVGLQVEDEDDEDDNYSLAGTPTKRSVGTGSTHSSPGYGLGVNTPQNLRSKHRRMPSSPASFDGEQDLTGMTTPIKQPTGANSTTSSPGGYSLGYRTPSHTSARSVGSTNSSPGYSLGQVDDDEDTDEDITPQLAL
jgi:hypothetical protein